MFEFDATIDQDLTAHIIAMTSCPPYCHRCSLLFKRLLEGVRFDNLFYHFSGMSQRKFANRRKGINCNKPLRRHQETEPWSASLESGEDGTGPQTSGRRPPWLKGKAIGLWYRDKNREKNKKEGKPMGVFLERSKQHQIEDVLQRAGQIETSSMEFGNIQEGKFKINFLNKIQVTFEEKLDKAERADFKPDPVIDDMLFHELCKKRNHDEEYKKMFRFRQTLPSYSKRKEIIDLINKNQIVVISGETGCGKTTQVVQLVLDDYIMKKKGSLYNAICTQPRRISAISVAERVAAERAESLGESIGYVIRLESELPKRKKGTITFLTTGILMQHLQSHPSLSSVTHLFIDEIHERDMNCDFLIALLKYIIPKRPDLKIVLMSATINADQFSSYFGGVPCIEIPGFTYPVTEYYLEDILNEIPFRFPEPRRRRTLDPIFQNHVLPYVNNLSKTKSVSSSVINALRNPESESLSVNLMFEVIRHISMHEDEGAILVFVPGLSQIQDLHKLLSSSGLFSSSKALIIPMHSIMPTVKQRKAFERPPKGIRKIVIATKIAETSITIDDVRYVVDCGRDKTNHFDLAKKVSTLEPEWETLANVRQRKGRAGRTASGKCYKLFTRAREETFEPFPTPEIQRSKLEEVILNAKFLQLGRVQPFLERVMDPPNPEAVEYSLKVMRTMNVLDSEERLTPLGYHLAKLPMDIQTGKMILMGALFGCLDPILSIAACLSFKDPFVFILNKQEQVQKKRFQFSDGEISDHYMFSNAIKEWEEAQALGHGYDFAYNNFLSHHNLLLISDMKRQFAKHLHLMNFVESDDPKHPNSNVNSENAGLVKAIVCSGLYPNVAMIKKIVKKKSEGGGRVLWKTVDHHKVEFHVKSLLDKTKHFESPFAVYFEKIKSSSVFLHDGTMVYPMALLFFGEMLDIVEFNKEFYIRVDDMIKFSCYKHTAVLVQKLRKHLLNILENAISNPAVVDWTKEDQKTLILRAIVDLITCEEKPMFHGSDFNDSV